MTTTPTTFAKRLFDFIRAHKPELASQRPATCLSNHPEYAERAKLRSLVQALFAFESSYRGAQQWLAGIEAPEGFASTAARSALHIVRQLIECQAQLTGPFWGELLSMPGMRNGEFKLTASWKVRVQRLPKAIEPFTGVTAEYGDDQVVRMTLVNGAAVNKVEKAFPTPNVEEMTLEQQIVVLNRYWTDIKHFVRETAKDPKHWPSKGQSDGIEKDRVEDLMSGFFRSLSFQDTELLRKHRNLVKEIVNTSL